MTSLSIARTLFGVAAVALFAAAPAAAATLDWSAAISNILEDLGGATYSGTMVDDPFDGQHVVPDVCGATCTVENEPGETNYVFSDGTAFVTDGVTQVSGVEASVNIQNNVALDVDEAALVSSLTGQNIVAGELVDVWAAASENAGASIEWEVAYLALDESLYDDTAYRPTPPPRSAVDLVVFTLDESDIIGTEIFSVLPEPVGGAALLGLVAGFGVVGRRHPAGDRR